MQIARAAEHNYERMRLRFEPQWTAFSGVTSQPAESAPRDRVRRRNGGHLADTKMNGHKLAKNRSPFLDCVQCFFLECDSGDA